ncbi:hypothetical protein CCACVL1_25689 [Corchorus capsularis]|uniref:Uncharacterized protein n=1 Tax=Corchorus capsularis TaxID=210143 RepID=A0A1R3GIA3_COCAP|nr:hypothetical protein CCACVL1_25689 [Corchorus capsularis]
MMNELVGAAIGEAIGTVIDVGQDWVRYLRIMVNFNLHLPMKKTTTVTTSDGDLTMKFKYEKKVPDVKFKRSDEATSSFKFAEFRTPSSPAWKLRTAGLLRGGKESALSCSINGGSATEGGLRRFRTDVDSLVLRGHQVAHEIQQEASKEVERNPEVMEKAAVVYNRDGVGGTKTEYKATMKVHQEIKFIILTGLSATQMGRTGQVSMERMPSHKTGHCMEGSHMTGHGMGQSHKTGHNRPFDRLAIPLGPMTRAQAKRFKEALLGLVQTHLEGLKSIEDQLESIEDIKPRNIPNDSKLCTLLEIVEP